MLTADTPQGVIGPDGLIIGKYAGEGPDFYEALHKTIK